eukprot:SAG11_NODE_2635_length_3149_cov_2.532787_2_plen_85_part_00
MLGALHCTFRHASISRPQIARAFTDLGLTPPSSGMRANWIEPNGCDWRPLVYAYGLQILQTTGMLISQILGDTIALRISMRNLG